jgi:hypothetical protein
MDPGPPGLKGFTTVKPVEIPSSAVRQLYGHATPTGNATAEPSGHPQLKRGDEPVRYPYAIEGWQDEPMPDSGDFCSPDCNECRFDLLQNFEKGKCKKSCMVYSGSTYRFLPPINKDPTRGKRALPRPGAEDPGDVNGQSPNLNIFSRALITPNSYSGPNKMLSFLHDEFKEARDYWNMLPHGIYQGKGVGSAHGLPLLRQPVKAGVINLYG